MEQGFAAEVAATFHFLGNSGRTAQTSPVRDQSVPWRKVLSFLEAIEGERTPGGLSRRVLDMIGSLIQFDFAFCVVTNARETAARSLKQDGRFFSRDVPPALLGDYFDRFIHVDPVLPLVPGLQRADIDWAEFDPSEFTHDFLGRYSVRRSLGMAHLPPTADGFLLALHRGGRTSVTETDRAILATIHPHLCNLFAACLAPEQELKRRVARISEETGLTPREGKVMLHLCERLSAGEIASRLCIGRRTVEKHLEHIYVKLGASGGRQLRERLLGGNP